MWRVTSSCLNRPLYFLSPHSQLDFTDYLKALNCLAFSFGSWKAHLKFTRRAVNFCEPNPRLAFVTKPEEFCLGLHFIADTLHSSYNPTGQRMIIWKPPRKLPDFKLFWHQPSAPYPKFWEATDSGSCSLQLSWLTGFEGTTAIADGCEVGREFIQSYAQTRLPFLGGNGNREHAHVPTHTCTPTSQRYVMTEERRRQPVCHTPTFPCCFTPRSLPAQRGCRRCWTEEVFHE